MAGPGNILDFQLKRRYDYTSFYFRRNVFYAKIVRLLDKDDKRGRDQTKEDSDK